MARQPKILVADEPTGNLDPENSDGIMDLLEEINKFGTTILVTTHDAEVVNRLKKRVVTLSNGKIIGDQKEGGHYDLDGSRTRIPKRSLGGTQTTQQAAPQPAPQTINSHQPPAATVKPVVAKPKSSGSAVLEQMRKAKATDEAKPVAKRRKFAR